jgi:hypothetical protein
MVHLDGLDWDDGGDEHRLRRCPSCGYGLAISKNKLRTHQCRSDKTREKNRPERQPREIQEELLLAILVSRVSRLGAHWGDPQHLRGGWLRGDFAPAGAQKLKSNFELQVRISHCEGSARVVERRKRVTRGRTRARPAPHLAVRSVLRTALAYALLFLAPKGHFSREREPRRRRLCRAETDLATINNKDPRLRELALSDRLGAIALSQLDDDRDVIRRLVEPPGFYIHDHARAALG